MSWPGQPAAVSATPAGAEPSVSPVGSVGPTGAAPAEACPLCGSPLQTDQDWCLYCGAAAHTRLSATPNWKAPLAVAIVVAALLLGVLAAALVKLARGPGPAPPAATTVITAPGVAGTTTPGATHARYDHAGHDDTRCNHARCDHARSHHSGNDPPARIDGQSRHRHKYR